MTPLVKRRNYEELCDCLVLPYLITKILSSGKIYYECEDSYLLFLKRPASSVFQQIFIGGLTGLL
jgi:hypothetical protein